MENGYKYTNGDAVLAIDHPNGDIGGLVNGHGHGHGPEVNGFDKSPSAPKAVKNNFTPQAERIKRKAKRLTKFLAKEVSSDTPTVTSRQLKNSRKSRAGLGRGLPKKGGAGGKGTWGALGSELAAVEALDIKDPNYDSESLDNGDITLEAIIPEMTDEELQRHLEGIVLEYFEHGDTNEVTSAVDEINLGNKREKVVVVAIEAAMDHKPSHRELTSVLISQLLGEIISIDDMAKAFETLLANLPELILDAPDAPTILGNFIARAVADDCLPAEIVPSWKEIANNQHAKAAIIHAEVLLVDRIGMFRLNNVWGVGGGAQPVKALSRRINMLLKEYLSSNDSTEAGRCLRELEVPHFHHELVFEAIVMAIERMQEHTEELICRLLASLFNSCLVTPDQMQQGFLRVYEELPDICIDVPAAYSLMERFVNTAQRHGFVSDEVARLLPVRGRKRFVSEGDGGKIKEEVL